MREREIERDSVRERGREILVEVASVTKIMEKRTECTCDEEGIERQ